MKSFPRVLRIIWSAAAVLGSASVAHAGDQAPANYRALIARQVLTYGLDKRTLNSAMISRVFPKWSIVPIQGRPTVCVSIDSENLLGMRSKGYFLFIFDDGVPRRLYSNALVDPCPGFTPFVEVRR